MRSGSMPLQYEPEESTGSSGKFRCGRKYFLSSTAYVVTSFLLVSLAGPAFAQQSISDSPDVITTDRTVRVEIPAGSLFESLQLLSRQSGLPVTVLPGVDPKIPLPAVSGHLPAAQALTRLLAGTGVPFRLSGDAVIVGAQVGSDDVEVLRPISVIAMLPQVSMPTENGSSGLSVIGQDAIKTIGTGDKDPVRLLRILPNVNWDNSQFAVSQSGGTGTLSEQDLTPERISISGGKVYENRFLIDGLSNVSGFDVTATNEADADKIGINNPMALFVNTDVLKEVAVYDSNVPARYSGFTGGVVDMRTRDPGAEYKGSVGYARESGDWVHYRNEGEVFGTSADKPQFTKNSYDMAVDAPLSPTLRTMAAASRVTSEQKRVPTQAYDQGDKSATESIRESYLLGMSGDIGDETTVRVKGLYAPYSQEFTRANMARDRQITQGNNYSLTGEVNHETDTLNANLTLGFSQSGFDRDAPEVGYTWRRIGSKTAACNSGTQCVEGGYGDISDTQRTFQAKGDLGATALGIDWKTGVDLERGSLRRSRDQETVFYFNGNAAVQANIVCPAGDPACVSGQQALRSRNIYLARDVEVATLNTGTWAEGSKTIGIQAGPLESLDVRAGLRADYGDYLENLNVAPRFSATLNFEEKVGLTFGANRYYSTDTLTYALYEKSPSALTSTRTVSGAGAVSAWTSPAPRYQYAPADVRTPYSDERTVALSLPLLWGDGRVKLLSRRTRDEITQTVTTSGGVTTRTPNNKGWTNYQSASLEWQKSMKNHAVLLSGSWSDTERSTESYMETGDDEDATSIYYNGSVLRRGQLPMLASNFSQPLVLNATWTSKWLDEALTLNLTGKYRFSRDEIVDSGRDISINGTSYSIWERTTRRPQARFDMTASYRIDTFGDQDIELFAYAENILNARSHTATSTAPLERGRSFWVGTRYTF